MTAPHSSHEDRRGSSPRAGFRGIARSLSATIRDNPFRHPRSTSGRPVTVQMSESKTPTESDFPLVQPNGRPREYTSNITGTRIVESSGPSKVLLENRYTPSTLVTLGVRLRETSDEDTIAALDTASCTSFIWTFEARTKFGPSKIFRMSQPMEFTTGGSPIHVSEYVIADIYLPANHRGTEVLAKTTTVLFLKDEPLPGGVDILLGMDYIGAQSISILTPIRTAVIGRCGNAIVPLTFERMEQWPLRRREPSMHEQRVRRVSGHVFVITAPSTFSGTSNSAHSSANTDSMALADGDPTPSVTDIMTSNGPHPDPLRSCPVTIPIREASATTHRAGTPVATTTDNMDRQGPHPDPLRSSHVRTVAPGPSASDDPTTILGPWADPIHSCPENCLIRLVTIPARPNTGASVASKRPLAMIAEKSNSRLESKQEAPLDNSSRNPVDTQSNATITPPVVKTRPVTISNKETFCAPRCAPEVPAKKVFARAGNVLKKAASKLHLRRDSTVTNVPESVLDISNPKVLTATASCPSFSSLHSTPNKEIQARGKTERKTATGTEDKGKAKQLSERVIPPNTRTSQLDCATAARYGAEEDSINARKTWV